MTPDERDTVRRQLEIIGAQVDLLLTQLGGDVPPPAPAPPVVSTPVMSIADAGQHIYGRALQARRAAADRAADADPAQDAAA